MALSLDQLAEMAKAASERGQYAEAESLLRQISAVRSDDFEVLFSLGLVMAKTNRIDDATHYFESALRIEPNSASALNWLSTVYRIARRIRESLAAAEQVVAADPDDLEGLFNLGLACAEMHRFEQSIAALSLVTARQPQAHPPYYHLGLAYLQSDQDESAFRCFEIALSLSPNAAHYHVALGHALLKLHQTAAALDAAKQALRIKPASTPAHLLMAKALARDGKESDAEARLRKAIAFDPTSEIALSELAMLLQARGEFEEATALSLRSLEINPNQALAHYSLLNSRRFTPEDRGALAAIQHLAEENLLTSHDQALLHYALGKAHQDMAEFELAMGHFDEANRLTYERSSKSAAWSIRPYVDLADYSIAQYTAEYLDSKRKLGLADDHPILIVGMIRSGTTLLEQMLSSHREIAAAGEQPFWMERGAEDFRSRAAGGEPDAVLRTAVEYRELLNRIDCLKPRITDKMPGNYAHLGLIHLHLPDARIVHIRRSPIDTCLSIWTTYFGEPPEFANSRENIVAAYRQYLRLMAHWRAVLPVDRFMEIDYEELVSAPEPVTRTVIQFCGLEWDEACLHPELNPRYVKTPSLWRVRQPVDRSSVERWRRYEPWLGEFLALTQEPRLASMKLPT